MVASKKILVIQGHPIRETFSEKLTDAYMEGARSKGAEIQEIVLRDLQFDLNFREGYRGKQELEPDLFKAQELIAWADHLVLVYPNWWSTFPALMKGFIDRTFLPGFAFKYKPGLLKWDRLLGGRSARLIVTMDNPRWYYRWVLGSPGNHAMKKGILHFCGIRPVRISTIGSVKHSDEAKRQSWLIKVRRLGEKMI
jgi:NAD(P)H dehydrogenase (quinone)